MTDTCSTCGYHIDGECQQGLLLPGCELWIAKGPFWPLTKADEAFAEKELAKPWPM